MDLADFAGEILQKLGSLTVGSLLTIPQEQIRLKVRALLTSLRNDIEFLSACLKDAGTRIDKNDDPGLTDLLSDIRQLLYEADDLVDEISSAVAAITTGKRRECGKETGICTLAKPTSYFPRNILAIVCSNLTALTNTHHFFWSSVIADAFPCVEKIRQRCRKFAEDVTSRFPLISSKPDGDLFKFSGTRRETSAFQSAADIIGRDKDVDQVVHMLLRTDPTSSRRISVISIVGMAGLGKTALAQLVFNHSLVEQKFKPRIWTRVGIFDLYQILQRIVWDITQEKMVIDNLEQLQTCLRERIQNKKYLLVLDDVWITDREKWLKLRDLLSAGAPGSKIIVTTRFKEVSTLVGTDLTYSLKPLEGKDACSVFKAIAFQPQDEQSPELLDIGRQFVELASNVPGTIKALRPHLYGQNALKWRDVLEKGLSKLHIYHSIPNDRKQNYDNLPFHLKRCFAYCAQFQSEQKIDKLRLVHLWIAQGFIQLPQGAEHKTLEDAGEDCIIALLRWNFFKDVTRDAQGNIQSFKMEHLTDNLAQSIAASEAVIGNFEARRYYHLFFDGESNTLMELPSSSLPEHLRSFLKRPGSTVKLTEMNCAAVFSHCRYLRALDLHASGLTSISNSIGLLQQLRYLDLSDNDFTLLPDSITKLVRLQVLDVSFCKELRRFPKNLRRLVNLRHLYLGGCKKLTAMPVGLSQMTSLQTLSHFVLSTGKNCCKLDELGALTLKTGPKIVFSSNNTSSEATAAT